MLIAIVTFDGFNEIDSMVAMNILGRALRPVGRVVIASSTPKITSMNGVRLHAQATLAEARSADAVIVGSGVRTLEIAEDAELMSQLKFDPHRQLIAAQCSGALLLAKLGLLDGLPACTDSSTKPWVEKAGIQVLDQPFNARGNVATAGGCLASVYLAGWIIARAQGLGAVRSVLSYVAPVGEKDEFVARAVNAIAAYLPTGQAHGASENLRTA
ncbi:MAG TPA: DJ-1/PfpI family protein [Steroidobacteraceae bacterium]|jgi:transcriptional regulator GlxA family with amidase domain|nr:DJ-1/PfpI family protein [Steroidobacteraceae bacterium]